MAELKDNVSVFKPEGNIKGVIQVLHGMCEHKQRYNQLAGFLAKNGFVVITSDLRGHGKNVSCPEDLGYFGEEMVSGLHSDIDDINTYVKKNYENKPYVLLGHSMGTLVATSYFKSHDNLFNGLILSGMPGDNSAKGIAQIMISIIAACKGWKYRSNFINNLCNGPFSKAFESEGSDFAWLSVDKDNVAKYENDPECGYVFTLNGFYTLMKLMEETYNNKNWSKENLSVPVRLISGSDDPCMGTKENFMKSVQLFKNNGYSNVTYELIEGQRHEIFNDTQREKTINKLLDYLNKIC